LDLVTTVNGSLKLVNLVDVFLISDYDDRSNKTNSGHQNHLTFPNQLRKLIVQVVDFSLIQSVQIEKLRAFLPPL
jgi:hypothetical protein